MQPAVFDAPDFPDYSLLDSGGGEKLERFGARCVRRPDPQAIWRARLPVAEWEAADLRFERDPSSGGKRGEWVGPAVAELARESGSGRATWSVDYGGATFVLRPTAFKHVGLFPEQASNWDWIAAQRSEFEVQHPRLLNLFGYSGAASVMALRAGYQVTHVDASKTALSWARDNLRASGLPEDAMRIVLDDAAAFARRESRRGERYQAVLLDPPHHGRGPKGQRWQFEEHILELVEGCSELLAECSVRVLSSYAIGTSPLAFANLLESIPGGVLQAGELALTEELRPQLPSRRLPAGFCARVRRGLCAS